MSLTLNGRQFDGDTYVNGRRKPGFHISFTIEHSASKDGNKAEVMIRNLSKDSRSAVQEKKTIGKTVLVGTPAGPAALAIPGYTPQLILEAGYADSTGTLFNGEATHIVHERTPTGFVTKASAADGIAARKGIVNASVAPGGSFAQAFEHAAEALGVDIKTALLKAVSGDFDGAKKVFANGLTMHGPAAKAMDDLAKSSGFAWSVQNGELVIDQDGKFVDPVAIVLGPKTGLIGSPHRVYHKKHGDKTITVARSLLQAQLTIGRKVVLESSEQKGVFKIIRTKHVGDMLGQDWYSEVEMVQSTSHVV